MTTSKEYKKINTRQCIKKGEKFSGKSELKLKIWIAICYIIYLTALVLSVASSNENNHEYHLIIYADEMHMINDTVELDCTMHGDNKNLMFYQMKSGK